MPHSPFILDSVAAAPPALKGGAVAIGNFDGVHRGHQAVIETAKRAGAALPGPTVAMTFEPHPRSFFKPSEPVFRLTPQPVKARLLTALGLDGVIVLPFNAALASIEAEAFVDRVLIEALGARHIIAGFDFHFGRGRGGSPAFLEAQGKLKGFKTTTIGPFMDESGAIVSSSLVREALERGDVTAANADLGWRWFVEGAVIHGDKRGRVLGFPTANMALAPDCGLRHGVYAVRALIDGTWYAGAANYGRRIQFGDGPALLETHVLDFAGDLYGRTIRIEFCGFLRPEAKFESVDALVAQMGRDVEEARAIVSAVLAAPRTELQARLEG